jgi:predicted nucleic acid-binding protein
VIVLDASAAVESLLGTAAGLEVAATIDRHETPTTPANFDAEVYGALRRLYLRRVIPRGRAVDAIASLRTFPASRVPIQPMVEAAALYIDRFGSHDVFYALLALYAQCPLLTCDASLARAARAVGIEVLQITPSQVG